MSLDGATDEQFRSGFCTHPCRCEFHELCASQGGRAPARGMQMLLMWRWGARSSRMCVGTFNGIISHRTAIKIDSAARFDHHLYIMVTQHHTKSIKIWLKINYGSGLGLQRRSGARKKEGKKVHPEAAHRHFMALSIIFSSEKLSPKTGPKEIVVAFRTSQQRWIKSLLLRRLRTCNEMRKGKNC